MSNPAGNASFRDNADIPWLLSAMKTESIRQKNAVKAKLLKRGPDEVFEFLEAALRDNGDADRRNAAMEIFTGFGRKSLPVLTRLLTDADWEVRNFACVMLGDIGSPFSVPALVNALNDGEPNVSHAAAEALGKIGDPAAVTPLMEKLDESDFWSAYPIISALGTLRDARAVPRLVGFLENELLAPAAVQALGEIGSMDALGCLLRILRQENSQHRDAALKSAMEIYKNCGEAHAVKEKIRTELSGESFSDYLVGTLEGPDYSLKEDALVAAGILEDEAASGMAFDLMGDENLAEAALEAVKEIGLSALPEARKHLRNPSSRVRQALINYFSGMGLAGADELVFLLHDEMAMIRAEAALALGSMGATDAVGELADLLEDESTEVREAAVAALANFPPHLVYRNLLPYIRSEADPQHMRLAAETLGLVRAEEAIKPLSHLLEDPRETIRIIAVKAIGRIGGETAVPYLFLALRDESIKVARQAVVSMGKVKDPHVLQRLIKFVRERDENFCLYAIGALKEQESPLAIFSLMEILKGSTRELKAAALEALGALGKKEACQAVLDAARTEDAELLRVCAQTLGRLGCEKAMPRLIELLSHEHWSVRAAAAEAVGMTGGEEAERALEAAMDDKDKTVRKIAAEALAKIR